MQVPKREIHPNQVPWGISPMAAPAAVPGRGRRRSV